MTPPIESIEDLANQNKILYGTVKGGSTAAFFEVLNLLFGVGPFVSGLNCSSLQENVEFYVGYPYAADERSILIEYVSWGKPAPAPVKSRQLGG